MAHDGVSGSAPLTWETARPLVPELALIAATIAYGATFKLVQDALDDVTPVGFILLRFGLGAIVLLPFAVCAVGTAVQAIWLAETGRNHERMKQLEERVFVGSLVGAVGTQASFGASAFELDGKVMARLGLGVADISWQPARDRLVEYVGVLGLIGGGLAKIANEIILLAHTEIDELAEPFNEGKVGSSTMPHKRNPSTCEGIVAVGRTLRSTVALMHDALMQEHERDASAWRFEWKALPEACLMTGAILAQMKDVLAGLEVHPDKMRRNLDALGGFLMSERVMFALADKVGKQTAHEVVYDASMRGFAQGKTFEQALMEHPRVEGALATEELKSLLDPTTYVGLAPAIVDRVLAETRASGWIKSL